MDEYWQLQTKMRGQHPRQRMFMLDGNNLVGRSPQHGPPLLLITNGGTAHLLIDSGGGRLAIGA